MIEKEVFEFFKKYCDVSDLEEDKFKSLLKLNNILLLSRSHPKYICIEQINDYEFTNSIAYEMLWRNDEFQELIHNNENLDETEYVEKLKEFGIYSTFKKLEDPYNYYRINISTLIYDENIKTIFKEDWQSYTLKDVENGLEKLINYYYTNSNIYSLRQSKYFGYDKNYVKRDIIIDEHDIINKDFKVDYILDVPHYYYINCDFSDAYWNKSSAFCRIQQISDNLPLQILEKGFLNSLHISDIKFKSIPLSPEYTHPELFFPEMIKISIPLNLGLKINELTSLISKLKEEIEFKEDKKRLLNIKDPVSLIKNENNPSEEIKKIKIFNQKTIKSKKKEIATAFYIYDTFKALEDVRELLIRDNIELKKYKKEVVYQELGNILGKDIKKLKDYSTYMKKLIDNKLYRELVTGKMILT
jgi:hypothetical protein